MSPPVLSAPRRGTMSLLSVTNRGPGRSPVVLYLLILIYDNSQSSTVWNPADHLIGTTMPHGTIRKVLSPHAPKSHSST
ncbi:Hypothetical protein FKW44_024586 [Caligus rogercresseyi]|uniref:Uncharacterized protein n=1 Tax=Caligus rogercresseyi TaxID=217165 RepID=A0A7T8GLW9_CALRO|nr:Hypothetical protein FKW44_024586 [Caligus rogercresseyi]